MIHSEVDIVGMPYVPGFATGRLQAGGRAGAGDLALIGQDDIARVATPPAGFIVVEGAPFSHTLITLLGWGVPTVLVSAMQAAELTEGMALHLDGLSGRISSMRPAAWPPTPAQDLQTGRPLHMADGEPVHLLASVRTPEAARHAAQGGASAIGLVRSEFLVPADGAIPDATFYRREIRALCEAAAPLPVTLRLLDLAMDKLPPWLPRQAALGQSLGLQGVRLYPTSPVREVVEAQLVALGELGAEFDLRLIIPFLVRLEELEYWQDFVRRRIPDGVPVGAMAETLASVLDIRELLQCADFVAIGCNDLMQALYAADRDQAVLRHYLDPYAPPLFRLLRQVAECVDDRLQRVQLCGVLPQIRGVLPLLLGLGFRRFSIDVPFLPWLARAVAGSTRVDCEELAARACAARTTADVLRLLELPADRGVPYLR